MTATETKHRRGTATQCDAMTPVQAEIVIDTTNNRPRVGDGSTAGGIPVPNAYDLQNGYANTATATGTNTIALTLSPAPTGYTTGMEINFKAANTITGAATINVNSLGAKDIYKVSGTSVVAAAANDIVAGAYYTARYDGTRFVLVGAGGGVASVTGSGGIVVSPTTGSPNATIDTNNSMGVGAYALLFYQGVTNLTTGSTTAGSNLLAASFDSNGGLHFGTARSGTWRNVSGMTLNASSTTSPSVGMFIRTA